MPVHIKDQDVHGEAVGLVHAQELLDVTIIKIKPASVHGTVHGLLHEGSLAGELGVIL
jgi:hypothetical protein